MKIAALAPHVGVEISQVQLAGMDEGEFAALRNAVAESGVAVVRDQSLSPEQHIALARRFGGIDLNNYFPLNGAHAEIAEVSKEENQVTNIGGGWHTDHSYDEVPAMGSILVARELPPAGGDTLFASMAAAWDSLSDGLKQTLLGLRAVHSADHIYSTDGVYARTDQGAMLRGQEQRTRAVHPVAIRHPRTGQRLLYVNPAFTLHFEGWAREESLPLLTYLYSVASREEFQCRVEWRPGTVTIWDNRSTWHLAVNDYHGHRRVMHRITLTGEPLAA